MLFAAPAKLYPLRFSYTYSYGFQFLMAEHRSHARDKMEAARKIDSHPLTVLLQTICQPRFREQFKHDDFAVTPPPYHEPIDNDKTGEKSFASFGDLPYELVTAILPDLSGPDVLNMRLVNRSWKYTLNPHFASRYLDYLIYRLTTSSLERLAHMAAAYGTYMRRVNISCESFSVSGLRAVTREVYKRKQLRRRHHNVIEDLCRPFAVVFGPFWCFSLGLHGQHVVYYGFQRRKDEHHRGWHSATRCQADDQSLVFYAEQVRQHHRLSTPERQRLEAISELLHEDCAVQAVVPSYPLQKMLYYQSLHGMKQPRLTFETVDYMGAYVWRQDKAWEEHVRVVVRQLQARMVRRQQRYTVG